MILNTILADSLRVTANDIEAAKKKGASVVEAMDSVARAMLVSHKRVIFNGNNYSKEWHEEAARRGLPNLRTTPDALGQLNSSKNVKLFESLGVLSKEEVESRFLVSHGEYCHKILIEAKALTDIAMNQVVPAAVEYQGQLASAIEQTRQALGGGSGGTALSTATLKKETELLESLTKHINRAIDEAEQLNHAMEEAEALEVVLQARAHLDKTIPAMLKVRECCDSLETLVPSKLWPLPTYHEMLFYQD